MTKRNLTKGRSIKPRPLLLKAGRKYKYLCEEGSAVMMMLGADGKVIDANNALLEMSGYLRDEVVGKNALDFVVPEQRKKTAAQIRAALINGAAPQFEVAFRHKDGSTHTLLLPPKQLALEEEGQRSFLVMGVDITERKRMEEELSRSSQFLGSVVENAYVWLDVLDSQHNVLVWNKAAETMSGYSREEVVGHGKIWEWLYPDQEYRKQTMETVNDILQSGRTDVDTETMIKRKDGQTRIISWNERALTDQDGKAIGTIAIGHDITERKRAEENLRQSEERYRSLFDQTLDGTYRSTHEGRFVDVNPALVKMFGYSSKQEMLDISDIKKELYFSPEERGSHILDTGQEEVEVYRMRRKDGSEIWVEDHGHYVHDEQGNIIYHEGILRDVTQRKRLEEELKQYSAHLEELVKERSGKLAESEARYRRLFEGSPISLWEEDFSEVKKYLDDLRSRGIRNLRRYFIEHPEDLVKCATMVKILDVNEATLRLYGAKTVEELRGELGRVFTHEFHDRFREELVALGEGKTQFASEFDNQTLTGDTKHVSVILSVIPGYEDTLAKVLVSTIDLTERKEMEQRLQQADRLAAVGETAAMVGHDLRNPLQGIAGAVHLLKQEALTAKERDEMLRLIEESVGYSDTIVRDLTEYSAEIKLNLIETTPKSIVREALGKVSVPRVVTVHDRSEERPTIKVDSDRMKRVFINLVDNAIDAMPQGGILTISGKRSDGSVEIEFSDTGSGMPEKVMKNLWKPLQTTKAKGLGLGLAICKRVVDAHGGSISVKSKAGEGTTVTIRLPIKPVAAEVTQE